MGNNTQITHPETAWLVTLVPVALVILAALLIIFVLRRPVAMALARVSASRAQQHASNLPAQLIPDPTLIYVAPAPSPQAALIMSATVAGVLVVGMLFVIPTLVGLLLMGPITAAALWGLLRWQEARYVAHLERELTPSVGRMSALLRAGNSFRQTLVRLNHDMDGPLRHEWGFLLERVGSPMVNREGIATHPDVVGALAVQTLSPRHATFLNHLSVAVAQPQDVLVTRVMAAYEAMQASDRRREEAVTELAQMRYSGIAIGLAGAVMALYLAVTQWERMVMAYSSPLGMIMAVIVVASLLLPIGGGLMLAQADDVDY
ncbi:MAG: hypothetical protein EI684_21885 [Candidatus Viridilinea halotolerans]|uniref:Type II secretion system protein GspF domain-containing protein n=1 Tax=Candidatus Viridilinea halotolerans TaxID=2491704 RepID=A0A426TR68_9CHLR|nr:MAG: hypothetical protein EI684_21885 [Candidatus Viridilinea halotolerans]